MHVKFFRGKNCFFFGILGVIDFSESSERLIFQNFSPCSYFFGVNFSPRTNKSAIKWTFVCSREFIKKRKLMMNWQTEPFFEKWALMQYKNFFVIIAIKVLLASIIRSIKKYISTWSKAVTKSEVQDFKSFRRRS